MLDQNDLQIDVWTPAVGHILRASHTVKVTHLPTGISVTRTAAGGQIQNKAKAVADLEELLKDKDSA